MSSRIHSILFHLALAFMGAMIASSLDAAPVEVALTSNGQRISAIGRKACDSSEMVEITLTDALKAKNDFLATFKHVKKETDTSKSKPETVCPNKLAAGDKSESFTKTNPSISMRKFVTDSACGVEGISDEVRVLCIYEGGGGSEELIAFASYRVETGVAKIESIGERTATNGEVSFEVKLSGHSGGAVKIETCYGKTADGNIDADEKTCPANFKTHSSSSTKVTITGLENVEYAFKVRLNDPKDGPSSWFKSFTETPIAVAFPLSYVGKGGDIQFTCQQSSPSSFGFLCFVLFLLALLRARKPFIHLLKTPFFLLFFCTALLLPKMSYAKLGQVSVGLLGSMYRPDLDNETLPGGEKVFPFYKCFFRKKIKDKDGPINPLIGGEVDVHLWDGFGSVQLGLGFGYTFVNGRALKLNSEGQPDCDNPVEKAKTTLHMYQLRPQLTYVFDHYAEIVPFVPYIRSALIGHGYLFRRGGKSETPVTTGNTTIKPGGFRFGYQFALGMMLMLDFLEPGAMRSARGQGILDHVFLKAELSYTKIDSFGSRGFQYSAKDVMGTKWPLLWTFGLVFELP